MGVGVDFLPFFGKNGNPLFGKLKMLNKFFSLQSQFFPVFFQ